MRNHIIVEAGMDSAQPPIIYPWLRRRCAKVPPDTDADADKYQDASDHLGA